MVQFQDAFASLYNIFFVLLKHYACLGSNKIQDLFGAKNHGNSISARSYEFFPHFSQLDTFDFTLSHREGDPHQNILRNVLLKWPIN